MKTPPLMALLWLLPLSLAAQNVPPLVNYQGRLSNPDGSPLATGNYQLNFSVFDAATNGNLLWGPQIFDGVAGLGHGAAIPVVQGCFNVLLGPSDTNGFSLANAFNGANRYVEMTVGANPPIAPRQQILTTPFAFQAANAALASNVVSGITITNLSLPGSAPTIYFGTAPLLQADGLQNFFVGPNAGQGTTAGGQNTACGFDALHSNTNGSDNTANGFQALYNNLSGSGNTASGYDALYSNTNGGENTADGLQALFRNTTGSENTACGRRALYRNTTGNNNTANGMQALFGNTTGLGNTASGYQALNNNTSGNDNTANGMQALFGNTTGLGNTASGYQALNNNRGSYNIALGNQAGANLNQGSNNIDIGNQGQGQDNATIRIGNQAIQTQTFIAGISGGTAAGGVAVYVAPDGQLGTLTSSARFKRDIRGMEDASDVLLSLHPVTFRYRPEIDPHAIPQFGLVAEEVEKVDPDLVARDDKNQVYAVRYEAVNAMLLNEFLKEHRKVQEQHAQIKDLQRRLETLEKIVLGQKSN